MRIENDALPWLDVEVFPERQPDATVQLPADSVTVPSTGPQDVLSETATAGEIADPSTTLLGCCEKASDSDEATLV